jgi:hypothetical protein
MVDRAHLGDLYKGLTDAELRRIWRTELVSEARAVLQEEMAQRGITAPELPEPVRREPAARTARATFSNPYMPPGALLADPRDVAVLSARGLVRLFQYLVIASTLIGILLWILVFVPAPVSEDARTMRDASGFDGLHPMASWLLAVALQVVFIVCALGLCFFKWWARWLYVGAYAVNLANQLASGTGIFFAWEGVLQQIMTLMDGAVLALAFLPPLARYFEADRTAT